MKQYIRFIGDITWHKVLKIDNGYVLYYDPYYEDNVWERIEYIEEDADKIPVKKGGCCL